MNDKDPNFELQINICNAPAHELLQTLHCIHFSDMPEALRTRIPDLVRECLSMSLIDAEIFQPNFRPGEASQTAPRPGLWKRLTQ